MTSTDPSVRPVHSSGTFTLGGKEVHRLGYGAMQITGTGVWGEPEDRAECVRTLRRAVELGVDLIDTADSYGPEVSEDIIFEALHPYPDTLLIATKAGLTRQGPAQWLPVGRPEYLRQQCEMSLRRLGVERIDLFQLHRIDAKVPADEQFGVASVQNLYNLTDQSSADVLDACTAQGIGFIPWFPIAAGALANPGGPVDAIAKETGASPSQVALAWLLHRSPVMLPIPGTKSVDHLEENCRAATLELSADQLASLDAAVATG